MQLARLRSEPGTLADFYQDSLEHLGAVCERTWFDRLSLIAEGPAARLWNAEGDLTEIELSFTPPGSAAPRDASRDVFPGCPLTFRLAEALLSSNLELERVVLAAGPRQDVPATEVLEKLWKAQWPGDRPWRIASPPSRSHHHSLLALVRGEIQAIEQHWSLHRVALSLPHGERDEALASALEFAALETSPNPAVAWPKLDPGAIQTLLLAAMAQELEDGLASIRVRQEAYLRRELQRIDDYFEGYAAELTQRATRTRSEESRLKADARLAAAKAEHDRRRKDQIQRHEIRVLPHLDALVLIAEPAWDITINLGGGRGENGSESARFVPRLRRWFRTDTTTPGTHSTPNDSGAGNRSRI